MAHGRPAADLCLVWPALLLGYRGVLVHLGLPDEVGIRWRVWGVGEWIGWDGSMLATVAGLAVGSLLGSVALAAGEGGVIVGAFLASVGAAVGNQISADWPTAAGALAVPTSTMVTIIDLKF